MGYGIALITGEDYTAGDAMRDAALGAVGAGLLGKMNTLSKLDELNKLTKYGQGEVLSGKIPAFSRATISQPVTMSEAKTLSKMFVNQEDDLIRGYRLPAVKRKTETLRMNFESSYVNPLSPNGNLKRVTNVHADVTRFGTQIGEGFAGGSVGRGLSNVYKKP